ncbi:MAG: Crp/Fnr family transcriptional regulator [Gammaproteobacteria bacterium]|nr:Crp/Fnr family transcriptional regulator [Gammaproteobacteria bacterium]
MEKSLKRGESLFREGDSGTLWRVEQGAILLQKATEDGIALTQMALPGDIIGVEGLCNRPYTNSAIALVETKLIQQGVSGDFSAFAAVAEGYLQQKQRMHDMSRLRMGSVASRIKHLVHLLAKSKDGKRRKLDRKELPTLREMSQIMDITGETICRELKALFPQASKANPSRASAVNDAFPLAA